MTSRKLRSLCGPLSLVLAGPLSAQDAPAQSRLVLDEIIVFAQKREELLQDVPVSVLALSGERLEEMNLRRLQDLQAFIPNLKINENAIGNILQIRGVGSGLNQGFEQSVGTYVDGVYRGRSQQARIPFLDIERVEVLRGPQSILFGKDTIAGAMNITTTRPTRAFEAEITGLYEPELAQKLAYGFVSGPLSETVAARFSALQRNEEGFLRNLTGNRDEPRRREHQLRGLLDWQIGDDHDLTLKAESSRFDINGREIEIVQDRTATQGPFRGMNYAQILRLYGQDASVTNNYFDYKRSSNGEHSYNAADEYVLTSRYYGWGDVTLTQILAYSAYQFDEVCDCDFTGGKVFSAVFAEDFRQLSYEVRLTSAAGGTNDWVVGYNYLQNELDFFDSLIVPPDSIMIPVLNTLLGPGAGSVMANTGTPRQVELNADLSGVFGQWSRQLDRFRVALGARLSHEQKDGSRTLTIARSDFQPLPAALQPAVQGIYAGVLNVRNHSLAGSRSKTSFLPSLSIQTDFGANSTAYATFSKGEKSGGFDARSNNTPANGGAFEFDDEESVNIELGVKLGLLDGRAELNAALFHTDFDDMQVSTFDGTLGYNVGNAARSVSRGLELDGRWRVTQNLTMGGSLAITDFEFKKFFGQCSFGQRADAPDRINCDYKGKTNYYLPDYSATLNLDYTRPVGQGLALRAVVDTLISDSFFLTPTLDPLEVQSAYVVVNAALSLSPPDERWTVALLGKNLTDRKIRRASSDVPLAGNTFGTPGFFALVEAPRTIALQATRRF